MNDFGFEIILYLNENESIKISPPNSLISLTEIALSKFNLTKAEFSFEDEDEDKIMIQSETDYFKLFNYVEDNELEEITININSTDKIKKKKQSRKNSRSAKPHSNFTESNSISRQVSGVNGKMVNLNLNKNVENIVNANETEDDKTLNDMWDAEDYRDLRNLKANDTLEEGLKYSKHGYNKKNQARIYYVKEKKDILKEEQNNREAEKQRKKQEELNLENSKIDENFGKRNKNKKGNKVK